MTSFIEELRELFPGVGDEVADQMAVLMAGTPLGQSESEHFLFGAMCVHQALPEPLQEVLSLPMVVSAAVRVACSHPTSPGQISDMQALQRIAHMLRDPDWGVGMLEDIAALVEQTGRSIANLPDDEPTWDRH